MSLALVINAGQVERVGSVASPEILEVRSGAGAGLDVSSAGTLELGITTANAITIGSGGAGGVMTTVAGDLTVSGNEVVVGTTTFQGNTQIGNAITDTLEVQASLINNSAEGAPTTLLFQAASTHRLNIDDAANETAGDNISMVGGAGGPSVGAAAGGIAGVSIVEGGTGGAGNTTFDGGAGGIGRALGGTGGAAAASSDGGVGGVGAAAGGTGGVGAVGQTSGAGGAATVTGGDAGAAGGGTQGVGGDVTVDAGVGVTKGTVGIGTTDASAINSGNTGDEPRWTHTGLLDLTQASSAEGGVNFAESLELNSTGTGAETASIMVGDANPNSNVTTGAVGSLFLDGSAGVAYLKTAGPSTWVAFAIGAGNNLQQAYDAAPDITQDATGGILIERLNAGGSADTHVLRLSDTEDLGDDTLEISKAPATGAGGDALNILVGANATGAGIGISHGGSGAGLEVTATGSGAIATFTSGANISLSITNAGTISKTPPTGEDETSTILGGGFMDIDIDGVGSGGNSYRATLTAGSAAVGGDYLVVMDGTDGTSTTGDVIVGVFDAAATLGGMEIGIADTAPPSVTVGQLRLQKTGGDTNTFVTLSAAGAWAAGTTSAVTDTAPDVTLSSDSTAAGATSGDVLIGSISSGAGTLGGVEIRVGSTAFAGPAAGTIDIAATVAAGGVINISTDPPSGSGGDISLFTNDGGAITGGGDILVYTLESAGTRGAILLATTGAVPAVTTTESIELRSDSGSFIVSTTQIIGSSSTFPITMASTTGAHTYRSTSAAAVTSGDVTLESENSNAAGTSGDVFVGSRAANGTIGGLALFAATAAPSVTAGEIAINASALIDVDSAAITIDATGAISIDAATASNITVSGGTADLTLGARAGTITLNESGETTLDGGFTATSIIGALNELLGGGGDATNTAIPVLAGEAIAAGAPVSLANTGGVAEAFEGDADSGDNRENVFGLAQIAISDAATGDVVVAGEVDVPDAQWDSVPVVGDVGDIVYVSETVGNLTLTAPSTGGSRVLKVGVVSRGGTGAVRVIVPMPHSVVL